MPRKKKPHADDLIGRLKAEYSRAATAHDYDELAEFKALCLSRQGYDPAVAIAVLAKYITTPLGAALDRAAREHLKLWHPNLAPARAEEAEGGGGLEVNLPPWAVGPEYFLVWCNEFRRLLWTPPADWKDPVVAPGHGRRKAEAEPAPKPSAEVDRAALIAAMKKPDKPEDGGGADGA